jgi:Flp pilus assembly protein TadD
LEAPQYYPLVFTSFRLERALWGLHPAGYHFVNLLLHSASALLLWRLLRQLRVPGAWLAAAVFALHPVNVESVAWITERKNMLSLFFFLLSLLWYLRFERQASAVDGPRSAPANPRFSTLAPQLWYGLSLLAFALALFSKTAVAPLPGVLLLLAWWQRGRVVSRDVWRAVPFLTAALLLIPLTVVFEHQAGSELVRNDSFWSRLAGAGWAFWFYLYKALLPLNLIFIYPRWRIDPTNALSYVPGLLVVLGLGGCWRYRRGWGKAGLFGLGYFLVMLLPALGFVNIYFMRYSLVSDHWQYFAIIGPIALIAAALTAAWGRLGRENRGLGVALGGALLLVLGALTWKQSQIYADEETLWRDTLARNPACSMAHNNLGDALGKQGLIDEAIRQFQEAVRLEPVNTEARVNLGAALGQTGQTDEAIRQFQEAIRLKPDSPEAHNDLGVALDRKGQTDEAIRQYLEALRLKPDNAKAHVNLGAALGKKGQIDEAIRQYQEALRLNPDAAEAHCNLGSALAATGQTDEAIRQFQEVLRLKPNFPGARDSLARALRATAAPAGQ